MTVSVVGPAGRPARRPRRTVSRRMSVRASPPTGWVPCESVLTAELTGGADDYEDYYCAKIEWDWGDDTRSEAGYDCEPYKKARARSAAGSPRNTRFACPGTTKSPSVETGNESRRRREDHRAGARRAARRRTNHSSSRQPDRKRHEHRAPAAARRAVSSFSDN